MHEVASQASKLCFTIHHIYREANQVADCLAGIGCSLGSMSAIWTSWAELPTAVKGPYRLDKIGCPSLRPQSHCQQLLSGAIGMVTPFFWGSSLSLAAKPFVPLVLAWLFSILLAVFLGLLGTIFPCLFWPLLSCLDRVAYAGPCCSCIVLNSILCYKIPCQVRGGGAIISVQMSAPPPSLSGIGFKKK